MSFFFAKKSKNKIKKILLGRSKSNILSLQLNKAAISYTSRDSSILSYNISPKKYEKLVVLPRKAKRTFLSSHLNGSITVEASIVLPIFVFAIISIIYFFNILYIQLTLQIHLENTAKLINASTCITTEANINFTDEESSLAETIIMDAAGNIALNSLFSTDELINFCNSTLIVGGYEGLSFVGSSITDINKPIDIVLTYKVRMPFISKDLFTFKLMNKCYIKPFSGKKLISNIKLSDFFVYVTKNGDVFHANKNCSHLSVFTALKNLSELVKEYPLITPCSFCSKSDNLISRPKYQGNSYVYVTTEYDVYHYLEICPALQRYLIRLNYEDAKDTYKPCNRCVVYSY